MSNSKAAEQAHKGDDIRESGEVSEVSDVENGQDSANPRQRLGQSDLPAALGDKGKKAKGLKKMKDISELLADMNAKNFEMIQRMVSSVGTKLEQKFSKMFGKASKVTSTVSKPPQDDVDESAAPCKTSDPVTDVDEGDDEVPYYDGDQDGPADQSDPLGLESVQQEDDVLSIFPRDSESFLGDTDFLPKVTKQAKARSLLFAAAKGEQACEKEGVEPPESLDKGKAEMLSKFLDSMSAGAKDKEPVGSQLFAKRFGEAPSFVASKEEPQFQLDQAQVNLINKYWRTKFPDRLAGYSEESYKILKVEEEFVGLTCVPTLDAFVKHVNVQNCEKVTKEGFRNRMWQNFETDLRKIHKGARVGMLAECLNQKILYNVSGLMHRWHESKVLSEEQLAEANQMLLASFDASNRSLEQFSRVGGLTHQVRRKVVLEDIKIPPKNRDAWLKLPLSGDGIMGKAFEENLESMAKMTKEYKASAAQLGYIAARGSKRPGSSAMGPPQKRQNVGNANPSSFHAYRDSGADWSARGRGAFRGRGRSSFRGRGGSNRGSWFSHQTQSTNASAAGPPARGPQWLSQGECGLQTRQSKSAKFSNSQTGGSGRRKVGTFSARVAVSNIRQMGFRGYTAWLRSRVCRYASPVFGYSKDKMPCQKQHNILLQEVHTLLSKQAIELVPPQMARDGFYSTLFMVPKKNSETLRPVINLKPLNQFLLKKSFKMDHLGVVMKLLREGDWALSIDLTDAYLHVPIRPNHRKFLRFAVGNHCYQFRCLPFGPTTAPRVFTKMLSAVMQFLREQGVQITAYLDDSLLFQNQPQFLCNSRDTTLQVLNRLGFLVNFVKSELVPSQSVKFIGAHFQLKRGIVSATQERFQKIKTLIQECSSRNQTSALMLLRILGVMASTIQVMRLGRLHMRPIQLYLIHFWSPKFRDIKALVPVNSVLRSHFQWWLQEENVLEGVPLQPVLPEVSITTDASLTGWGAVCLDKAAQGCWSEQESQLHINLLEMEAVIRAVRQFRMDLMGKAILIRSDNMSVVTYINKQGGTRSPSLCMRVWQLFMEVEQLSSRITATHVAGILNQRADHLSRFRIQATEWMLNRSVVHQIFHCLGRPLIDLFASDRNHVLPTFCSWLPSQNAYQIDAFSLSWTGMFAYAYPPICLIPRILQQLAVQECTMILVAPWWPRRSWFTQILSLLVEFPVILPARTDLLKQPQGMFYHHNPSLFKLVAWKISSHKPLVETFQSELRNWWVSRCGWVPGEITQQNTEDTIVGVWNGVLIPAQHL